jgi:hypothetical protein
VRRFARPDETVRISLREFDGSDDWVDVRATLSYRDHLELRSMAVSGAVQTAEGMHLQIDTGRAQLELLCRAIVAWSLRASEHDPAPLPVTRELIERLDQSLGDWLAQRIDQLYQSARPNSQPGSSAAP